MADDKERAIKYKNNITAIWAEIQEKPQSLSQQYEGL